MRQKLLDFPMEMQSETYSQECADEPIADFLTVVLKETKKNTSVVKMKILQYIAAREISF